MSSATAVRSSAARPTNEALRGWITSAVLFAAAEVAVAFRLGGMSLGSGNETVAVARNLAQYGQFANPYSPLDTGITAHVAPLYPFFLSLLVRIFGYSTGFGLAASFCSMAAHGVNAALLPIISGLFFGDRRPGIVGAVLSIVLPLYFFFPQFEVIYFATALMLFVWLTHWLANKGGAWPGFAAGLAFGILALLNPASTTVAVPWLAYASWRHLKRPRAAFLACLALGAVVALTPWTWRNYRAFHALFFVRDNLGLELFVSNTDTAQATYHANSLSGLYSTRHPDVSLTEAREVARLGEIEYNRRHMAAFREWISSHPARFLALSAARARMFWFPAAEGFPVYAFGIALVTVCSAFGFALMAVRRESILWFLAAVQLFYPILYYLVQNDPRFRAPILWTSLLATGYLAVHFPIQSVRRLIPRPAAGPGNPPSAMPSPKSPAMERVLLPGILGILAVLTTAIYTVRGIHYPITGGGEAFGIMNSLIRTGSFANPFAAGDTGPSAWVPPLYPLFRAGLALLFGSYATPAALLITLLVHGLHAALLPGVSRLFFGRIAPGVCAAILATVFPLFDVIGWEAMYVAAGVMLFYLYSDRVYRRPSLWRGAGLGLAAGLLLLANPSSLLAFAPWLLVLIWRGRRDRLMWRATAGTILAAILTCLPWTVRNYRQFGQFVFIRDNLGLTLYLANNDCARPSLLEDLMSGCDSQFNPMHNIREVELIRRVGEVEYNRDRGHAALDWMARQPRRFATLTARRVVEFWFPLEAYSYWIATALAIPGLLLIFRRSGALGWAMLAACALFTMLYAITEVMPRYRYPIMWMTLLQAGFLIDRLLHTLQVNFASSPKLSRPV